MMPTSQAQMPHRAADLEAPLAAVEARLGSLGAALVSQNAQSIETEAAALQGALLAAVHRFSHAARQGAVPQPLRQRLAVAGGQVAAQRESLARATAALDRAIDVLLPHPSTTSPIGRVYTASGATDRAGSGSSFCA
jgi:hypothetical protein